MYYQKCDVCKKNIKGANVSMRYTANGHVLNSKHCDLCGNCGKSILAFLNKKFPPSKNKKENKQ